MNEEKLKDDKEVAYYSALINAWITTRLERDRTLLILSSGAIGILVTLSTTNYVVNYLSIVLYVFAFVSFLVNILIIVFVFKKNSDHIELVLKGNKNSDPKLDKLDNLALWSFIIGVIFSILIGINSAFSIINTSGENKMNNPKQTQKTIEKEIVKSLSGVGKISPQSDSQSNKPKIIKRDSSKKGQ